MRAPALAIPLLVLLCACGKGKDKDEDKDEDKPGGGAAAVAAGSPEEAFRAYVQASIDGKPEVAWSLHSAEMQKGMDEMLGEMRAMPEAEFQEEFGIARKEIEGLSTHDAFVKLGSSDKAKARGKQRGMPAIDKVDKQGKEATVHFTEDGGTCRVKMIEEPGGWKVNGLVACRQESPKPAIIGPGGPDDTSAGGTGAPAGADRGTIDPLPPPAP